MLYNFDAIATYHGRELRTQFLINIKPGAAYLVTNPDKPLRLLRQAWIYGWQDLDGEAYLFLSPDPHLTIKIPAHDWQTAINSYRSHDPRHP